MRITLQVYKRIGTLGKSWFQRFLIDFQIFNPSLKDPRLWWILNIVCEGSVDQLKGL